MLITPKTELEARTINLQSRLREKDLSGALILQNADMFYYTGTVQQAYLYIPVEGAALFFVAKGLSRANEESTLDSIFPLNSLSDLPKLITEFSPVKPEKIGFEGDVLPYNLYKRYEKILSPAKLIDIGSLIREQRMVKSPFEIEMIREACRKSLQVFSGVKELIRDGMREFELVTEIETISRAYGHPAYIRPRGFNQEFGYVQLLTGSDAAVPSFGSGPLGGRGASTAYPHGPSNRIINANEPIILDYEGWHEGYMSDMTRTYCIGELPQKLEKAYSVAVEIRDFMLSAAKIGANCNDLYQEAYSIVEAAGLTANFMGLDSPAKFVAHGVGLEVDELPVVAPRVPTILEEGMILAVEPKFTFPEGAVGIEDTCVVRADRLENLSELGSELIRI